MKITTKTGFYGNYPMMYGFFDENDNLVKNPIKTQVDAVVNAGCHGVSFLGLGSEVHKMNNQERMSYLEWTLEALNKRIPSACTVSEPTVKSAVDFINTAKSLGADWIILQPARVRDVPEMAHLEFFGAVADKVDIQIAIQVAPEYLGQGFSGTVLKELNKRHSNISMLKMETDAVGIEGIVESTDGCFDVFNGQAVAWMPDAIRAGAIGFIPASETCDVTTQIFNGMNSEEKEHHVKAEELYCSVLPLLDLFHTIDNLAVYGKELIIERCGIEKKYAQARIPKGEKTKIGAEIIRRYAKKLGPLFLRHG